MATRGESHELPSPDAGGHPHAPGPASAPEQMLAAAVQPDELLQLQRFAAAREAVARHCRLAFEEFARLAVYRLRVERKLGATLIRLVRRGGNRSKSTRLTSNTEGRLPPGLTKQMAAKYRQLARIDDAVFDAYLARAAAHGRLPSANGARAYAGGAANAVQGAGRAVRPLGSPAHVLATVRRFLGGVDVYVGLADVESGVRLPPAALQLRRLHGRVVVDGCTEPALWLPRLAQGRLAGAFTEVVAALVAATGAPWFRALAESEWSCCFVAGDPALLLAYHGPRQRLFTLAVHALGPVFRGSAS